MHEERKYIEYAINGGIVLIDAEDYELIRQYNWYAQYEKTINNFYRI